MNRPIRAAGLIIMLVIVLAGCNLPAPPPTDLSPDDAVNTAAAQTVVALSTELAAGRSPTLGGPSTGQNTPTPPPGSGGSASTPTPSGGDTGPTVDPNLPCNQAEFISDVTIPDDSTLPPGTPFVKVWEVRNAGSCAWTPEYSVVFAGSGDAMSGPASSPLLTSGEVKPGQTARVSVSMRAPAEAGDYRGSWLLRSPDGKTFGVGPTGNGSIFVQIHVADTYSFAEHLCSAAWSTAAAALPCPGKETDAQGFVVQVEDPTLETGAQEQGLGLLVLPQPTPGGYIVGRYPPIMVPSEADFRATIGCRSGVSGCYVRFKVTYQIDNGPEQTLGEWNEGQDGNVNRIAADLDTLAGKPVAFNLYVYVSGTPDASRAIWFDPRVIKQ